MKGDITGGANNRGKKTSKLVNLPSNIKSGDVFNPTRRPQPLGRKATITQKPSAINSDRDSAALDDKVTDSAIDDIVIKESNQVLANEDAQEKKMASLLPKPRRFFAFNKVFKNKWFYIILPVIIIILIFAVPYSRYKILGLVLKRQFSFSVTDSSTGSPVGGAIITIGGHSVDTSSSGKTSFNLSVGKHYYAIQKHLYKTSTGVVFIGILKSKPKFVSLVATGRQIAIQVTDKLTGKPITGAEISVLGTSSTTNAKGQTSIVLPTKSEAYLETIIANGYNKQTTSISLLKQVNNYALVPSGSLFFLTTNSGVINVTKTNLDGSNPQILVAGTGHETASTTSLVPSADWKYLLLEANRGGTQSELYIIDSSTGTISEFDSSPDQFTLLGWSGEDFIYDEINQSAATSTVGREQLKSYDAVNARLNILDENQVNSTGSGYAFQTFSAINLISSELVYYTNWSTSGTFDTTTLTSTIRGIQATGINKNDFQSFATPNTGPVSVVKNAPGSLYFSVPNTSTNQTSYYAYSNGAVNTDNSLTSTNFSQTYPTYYLSPSGSQTLWTQTLSNQSETFIGDQNGQNQKQITLPSGMSAYSWYDNIYILLSKSSQLYIDPANGSFAPTLVGSYLPSAL